MKSKTQISIVFISFLLVSVLFFSCKKDSTNTKSLVNANTADNAITNTTTDSTLTDGLVAWYTFNGDVLDHSGHHNDIIFNNATPAKGESGIANTAYRFDGASSYMQIANSNSLNPEKITLFALFKTQGFYQGVCHSNRLISKGYNDYDNGRYDLGYDDQPYYGYQGCSEPVIDSAESPYGTFGDGQASASGVTADSKFIHESKWTTLTYVYNGTYSKLYINGNLVSSAKKSTSFTANSNTPLFLGRNEDPSYPYYFNGVIDEIRIYRKPLNATEVQVLDYLAKHQN